jgi:hypothetical protein
MNDSQMTDDTAPQAARLWAGIVKGMTWTDHMWYVAVIAH